MKKIYLVLMIIGGILIIGSIIAHQILKPESNFSFDKTLQSILNPNTSLGKVRLGQGSFSQFSTSGKFYYKLLSRTGNESLYSVSFKDINKTHTTICLEADFDEKEIITYKDEEQKEINKNYTYSVPSTLSFYKTEELSKQSDLTKTKTNELSATSSSNPNKFCYTANKEKDFYLKFGDNSTIIILEAEVVSQALLVNVTAETGNSKFTHLNISTTAPYNSLVGYWSFDGDKTNTKLTTHYDFTKKNNDGTGVADAFVNSSRRGIDCKYDDCLYVDGGGDYVQSNSNPSAFTNVFRGNTNWTISLFMSPVNVNIQAGDRKGVFCLSHDTGWADSWEIIFYSHWNTEEIYLRIYDGSSESETSTYAGAFGSPNQWVHVVYTWNGTTIIGYFDSVKKTSNAFAQSLFPDENAGNIYFGDSRRWGNWNGSLDEIMVFNTSLTQAQITDIYKNKSARFADTGTQQLNNQSYLNLSGDYINITTTFDNNFNSNVSLFLQYYESGSWTSTSAQNISNGTNATFDIGSSFTNITLNYTLIAGNDSITTFYTPIVYGDINIWNHTIGAPPADTCDCPGLNNNWEIDMSDYCNITSDCNLGTGKLNWTGTGWANCSAIVNTTDMTRPDANQILYIAKDCVINIFSLFWGLIR